MHILSRMINIIPFLELTLPPAAFVLFAAYGKMIGKADQYQNLNYIMILVGLGVLTLAMWTKVMICHY